MWTGEFDLNALCVDRVIFESGKKKLRIQKYPDTCGRGLNVWIGSEKYASCRFAYHNKFLSLIPSKNLQRNITTDCYKRCGALWSGTLRGYES